MTRRDALADQIAADIAGLRPFRDLGAEEVPDIAAAHDLQARVVARAYGEGAAIGGRKIAWNGPGQFAALGLEAPGAACVPAALIRREAPRLAAADYRAFAIEPEIAAVLDAPLAPREGGHDRASVAAAIARLVPAFELLDPRGAGADGPPRPESVVASNINNRGLVLGGPGLAPEAVETQGLRSLVTCNGETLLDKTGAAPMDPLDAALFLANHFTGRGITLQAGEALLLGAHLPPRPVAAPARLRFELDALGAVEFEIA